MLSQPDVMQGRTQQANQPPYWMSAELSSLEKIREFEQVPLSQRQLPLSTYEFLRDGCAINPDAIAIHYFADASSHIREYVGLTFKEVFERITQTANLFHGLGVGSNDVVSLMLPNIPESQFALWGAEAAGIANPINWMLEPAAIAGLLNAAGTKVLVAYGGDASIDFWDKVLQVQKRVPQLKTVVRLGGDRSGDKPSNLHFVEYLDVIDSYQAASLVSGRVFSPDDVAAFFPTGGTTNAPKLAKHTHANQVTSAWLSAMMSGLQAAESRFCASPLFHVVGAMATSLATLGRGARLVMATSAGWRDPQVMKNFWHIVETFRVTVAPTIPTILNQLARQPVGSTDISSLRLVTSGAAPLSEHIARSFHAVTNKHVCEGYGMTETTSVIIMNPSRGQVKTGSVGLRFPYHRTRIVAFDSDNAVVDCKTGEYGTLAISGPAVFSGYVDQSMDAGLWLDHCWLNTGDLVREDSDGYIWITGRAKDVIIRGGHNIDPRPIEDVFYSHPDVLEAGVVGRADCHAGEVPVVYIALRPGARQTPDSLLDYAKEHIAERASIPKDCYLMEALPRSSIGKILKSQLRADAATKAFFIALEVAGLGNCCDIQIDDLGAKGLVCMVQVLDPSTSDEQVHKALAQFTVRYEIRRQLA